MTSGKGKPDMVFTDGPYACPGQGESGRITISWKSGRTRGWCFAPFMRMRNWQRRTTVVYRRPYIRYHPGPVRKVNEIYVNAMSRLDNGRDMIKKIYVLDGPTGTGRWRMYGRKSGKSGN